MSTDRTVVNLYTGADTTDIRYGGPAMADIPDLGSRDPVNADRPATGASNGVSPGQTARLLRGSGAIGGAQEAQQQPTKEAHPHGPFVDRDGNRYRVPSR